MSFKAPKILVLDIETSPLISYTWGLFEQNIGLNQIESDWHILAFSAKWYEDKNGTVYGPDNTIIYMDQRNSKNIEDDKKLLAVVWKLMDEADILLTQNGKSFDSKKLNARFLLNGFPPPSSYKHIDTLLLARKYFKLTSNKLEYMTDKLCKKYKKMTKRKFAGFDLWKECLLGNKDAWKEMEKYNKQDVLALEELYSKLAPWDNSINFNLYDDSGSNVCKCGSTNFIKKGFHYTSTSKFQRYRCKDCGSETRDRTNLFSKEKKKSIRVGTK